MHFFKLVFSCHKQVRNQYQSRLLQCMFQLFCQNFESGTDGSGIIQELFRPVFRSQRQPSLVCFNYFRSEFLQNTKVASTTFSYGVFTITLHRTENWYVNPNSVPLSSCSGILIKKATSFAYNNVTWYFRAVLWMMKFLNTPLKNMRMTQL